MLLGDVTPRIASTLAATECPVEESVKLTHVHFADSGRTPKMYAADGARCRTICEPDVCEPDASANLKVALTA